MVSPCAILSSRQLIQTMVSDTFFFLLCGRGTVVFWLSALSPNHALLESSYMSSWLARPIRPQTFLRVILALVTTAIPLLAIAIGGADLLSWIRYYRGTQYYYVEYWSLRIAGWFLLVGMIGVLATGRVLFQRQARLRWLWLPTLASLFLFLYPSMISFALASPFSYDTARNQVHHQLARFASELRQATKEGQPWHCASGSTTTLSPYSRAGERLFYQHVCVAADRPPASLLASSAPGTIYIATGSNEKVVWLMATVLPRNASDTVSWLRGRSGEPLMLTDFSLSEWDHIRAD